MKKIIKQLNMLTALLFLSFAAYQTANAATLSLESLGGASNFNVAQGAAFDVVVRINSGAEDIFAGSFDINWTDPNLQFNSLTIMAPYTAQVAGDNTSNPNLTDGLQYVGGASFGSTFSGGDFVFATLNFTANGALTNAVIDLAAAVGAFGWVSGTNTPINFTNVTGATVSTVPVPPAVLLFGTSLLGLIGVNRRRKLA